MEIPQSAMRGLCKSDSHKPSQQSILAGPQRLHADSEPGAISRLCGCEHSNLAAREGHKNDIDSAADSILHPQVQQGIGVCDFAQASAAGRAVMEKDRALYRNTRDTGSSHVRVFPNQPMDLLLCKKQG